MRERSAARYSFICLRRLRSTAMWVIRWLSASSLFLNGLVRRRRFLLSDAGGTDTAGWATPAAPDASGGARAAGTPSRSWNQPCSSIDDEHAAASQPPPAPPSSIVPSTPPNRPFHGPPAMAPQPKRRAPCWDCTRASNAMLRRISPLKVQAQHAVHVALGLCQREKRPGGERAAAAVVAVSWGNRLDRGSYGVGRGHVNTQLPACAFGNRERRRREAGSTYIWLELG
jgi:hypothetical protein